MGLFDFLKKKEFDEINRLKVELDQYKSSTEKFKTELIRYSSIINIEEETKQKKEELDVIVSIKRDEIESQQKEFDELNVKYQQALETYKKLRKEVAIFENQLDLIEFGIYEPVYEFDKSDDYRQEQNKIVEKLKTLIKLDNAAYCSTNWTVEGSEAKGRRVVGIYKKLLIRAFNGECDVMIAKVKWNNINQMKERMIKVYAAINKLGVGFHVSITPEYFTLKQNELILEYEYQAKKQEEKEELRAIQEELREEEKARRDFEKAEREAEKQEAIYNKILDKVRKEFALSDGHNAEELQKQIQQLEKELQETQEKKERALSMAQQTKLGHVYIISNIGAFGENVYKIGMTRRLEPLDRVKELGDASVPFQFDIHAMIYSDEARTLECELHKAFTHKKVNMLNYRKEFFKVTLDEIEEAIADLGFEAELTKFPEAMEYRETLAILEKLNNPEEVITIDELIAAEFPESLMTQP